MAIILDPKNPPFPTHVTEEQSKKLKAKREKTAKSQKPKVALPAEPKTPEPQVESKQPEAMKSMFPTEGKLNKYGFIYCNDDVLNAWLGHGKGTDQKISIDLKEGNLIISKA